MKSKAFPFLDEVYIAAAAADVVDGRRRYPCLSCSRRHRKYVVKLCEAEDLKVEDADDAPDDVPPPCH